LRRVGRRRLVCPRTKLCFDEPVERWIYSSTILRFALRNPESDSGEARLVNSGVRNVTVGESLDAASVSSGEVTNGIRLSV